MKNVEKRLESYLHDYRRSHAAAIVAVQAHYPIGTPVKLKNGEMATVHGYRDVPDKIDLEFDNHNVWTTSVDEIERA